jgi:PAS domain S-box-containing protein
MMGTIVLGQVDEDESSAIRTSARESPDLSVLEIEEPRALITHLELERDETLALVLGSRVDEPVRLAQRAHAVDDSLSVLILSDEHRQEQLRQALQFSPFLGPEVRCWSNEPGPHLSEALTDAVRRTRERRRYRTALVASQQQQIEALKPGPLQPAEYLDRLLDEAPIGVVLLDTDGLVLALNRRARELLDVTERRGLSSTFAELFPKRQAVIADLISRSIGAVPRRAAVELELERASRSSRWLEVTAGAMYSQRGARCVMVILQDVTSRKRAEEHQRRMMNELDHRVKNTLAVVLTIARQTTATNDSFEGFIETFTGRIQALSRSHEALAAAKWEGAELREIVRLAVGTHADLGRGRVRANGERVLVPARASSPVSMALHELTTNAMKYGALSDLEGRVEICWRCGSDRVLHLEWNETGGPPVVPPTRFGVGREVIKDLVEYELSGRVQLDFHREGLRCSLVIPLGERPTRGPSAPGSKPLLA